MNLKSLALRTDLITKRYFGEILDRGNYMVIRTPLRPKYFWGNFLIMQNPPAAGDLKRWIALFEQEIGPICERGFIALTWDTTQGELGEIQPFLDYGFSLDKSVILTAEDVRLPRKYNSDICVKQYGDASDWGSFCDIHYDPDWQYGDRESQMKFHATQMEQTKAMVDNGLGARFCACLNGKRIADAGIFWDGDVGRFNRVVTHRDYRRLGACSTLVYQASVYALSRMGIKTLVMEADEDYHAARIYESVGFRPAEKLITLEWFTRDTKS